MKNKRFKSQKGQSFVEYALILVAVLVFGALLILALQEYGPRVALTVECVIQLAAGADVYQPQIGNAPANLPQIDQVQNCVTLVLTDING